MPRWLKQCNQTRSWHNSSVCWAQVALKLDDILRFVRLLHFCLAFQIGLLQSLHYWWSLRLNHIPIEESGILIFFPFMAFNGISTDLLCAKLFTRSNCVLDEIVSCCSINRHCLNLFECLLCFNYLFSNEIFRFD